MNLEYYEEKLTNKEKEYIASLLEKDSIGYFKVLRMIFLIVAIFVVIVWVVTTFSEPQDELEEAFTFLPFLLASFITMVLIMAITIYAKKRFSWKFKRDLRKGLKVIYPAVIQRKQYMASHQACYFYIICPGISTLNVTGEDFQLFNEGDIIHVEVAKYSKTYLGYF